MKFYEQINMLFKHQKAKIKNNGIEDYIYMPKVFFIPKGETELHISLFPSEIKKLDGKDMLTEKVNTNYVSEDYKRTLYQLSKDIIADENEHKPYVTHSGNEVILIPISKFTIVPEKPEDDTNGFFNEDHEVATTDRDQIIREIVSLMEKLVSTIDELLKKI